MSSPKKPKSGTWRRKLPPYRELWEVNIDGLSNTVVVSDARDCLERALFELGKPSWSPCVVYMRFKGHVS